MAERENYVYTAKLAEQAERYDGLFLLLLSYYYARHFFFLLHEICLVNERISETIEVNGL